jgi:ribosomal protein uS17
MNKTIVVEVERRVPHAKFKKIVRKTSKFYAHDESSQAKEGDKVLISETRPLSKLKRWNLVKCSSTKHGQLINPLIPGGSVLCFRWNPNPGRR